MTTGIILILVAVLSFNVSTCTLDQMTAPAGKVAPIFDPEKTMEFSTRKQFRLRNLRDYVRGRTLKIATMTDYPLSYTEEDENGKLLGKGISFQLIDFLAKKFNFSYDVVLPKSNIIGSNIDFGDSLMELVNSSEADMAAAFVPILSENRNLTYYSATILDEGEWVMIMSRPRESATGSGLLAPFDKWVWMLILVSMVAVAPIIYGLIMLRNKLTGDDNQKSYSLNHCAWFVYGAIMKQGSTLSPIADSTRLLFATWWIFITILASFYTANLTAFLTLSKFTLPFNTVNDILYRQKHFVALRGGGIEYSIRNENETLSMLTKMLEKAAFVTETNDTNTLLSYVEKQGYVFVRDRPAMTHLVYNDYKYRKADNLNNEKLHCPFAVAKKPFLTKKRSFIYPIGTNLSELFDPELLNLVEAGVVKYLTTQKLPNVEICPQDLGGTDRQLQNTDLIMTYYIMFAGFATSIAVFTSEVLFRYLNDRRIDDEWKTMKGSNSSQNAKKKSGWNRFGWGKSAEQQQQQVNIKSRMGQLNVTPPPPYTSIYNKSRANRFQRDPAESDANGVKRFINGRDYLVFRNANGGSQLVPVRAPSATLFQYSYTE